MKNTAQNKSWKLFLKLCLTMGNEKQLDELFKLLLTTEERNDISDRYLIVKALMENKMTQREIAENFGVSISKITRGSNALKIIDSQLRKELIKFFNEDEN